MKVLIFNLLTNFGESSTARTLSHSRLSSPHPGPKNARTLSAFWKLECCSTRVPEWQPCIHRFLTANSKFQNVFFFKQKSIKPTARQPELDTSSYRFTVPNKEKWKFLKTFIRNNSIASLSFCTFFQSDDPQKVPTTPSRQLPSPSSLAKSSSPSSASSLPTLSPENPKRFLLKKYYFQKLILFLERAPQAAP